MADRFAFSPETLIKAYSLGVFPMADSADSREIKFYDPEARALIPLAWREGARHEFHIPRRLARTIRRRPFTVGCGGVEASATPLRASSGAT